MDKLIEQQSIEADQERRKQLVWAIERKLAEDGARPIIFYTARRNLLAALRQGADASWSTASSTAIAHGRRLARQIAGFGQRQRTAHGSECCGSRLAVERVADRAGAAAAPALAQKAGGVLRLYAFRQPGQHVDPWRSRRALALQPMMACSTTWCIYDQHVRAEQHARSIVPDLATSWSWSEDGTELTFTLRQGVKWHDGKPFTAADVKCTWDLLLGKAATSCASIRASPGTATSTR